MFNGIHTPAGAWRHAANALRRTEADMRDFNDVDPYTRGMADAAEASARVLDHLANEYDAWNQGTVTDCAEKIMLYVQREANGYLVLATTNPNDLMSNLPTASCYVWIEK